SMGSLRLRVFSPTAIPVSSTGDPGSPERAVSMPLKRRREKSGLHGGREEGRWSLAIHGGAGSARADALDARREQEVRAALARVLEAGARQLAAGGSSLDV